MWARSLEERVSNAVIGLEALFSQETAEVNYRMRLLVTKVLSNLGENATNAFNALGHAYGIRSKFAHGDRVSQKDRAKIAEAFGDEKKFEILVLNFLRLAQVAVLVSAKSKKDLIELIDLSLLDVDADRELKLLLRRAKSLV